MVLFIVTEWIIDRVINIATLLSVAVVWNENSVFFRIVVIKGSYMWELGGLTILINRGAYVYDSVYVRTGQRGVNRKYFEGMAFIPWMRPVYWKVGFQSGQMALHLYINWRYSFIRYASPVKPFVTTRQRNIVRIHSVLENFMSVRELPPWTARRNAPVACLDIRASTESCAIVRVAPFSTK